MLLEDPADSGVLVLASRGGRQEALPQDAGADERRAFLASWRRAADRRSESRAPASFFYAAYEAGGLFERLPEPKTDIEGPMLWRFSPDAAATLDDRGAWIAGCDRGALDEMTDRLLAALEREPDAAAEPPGPRWPRAAAWEAAANGDYEVAVARVREWIAAGDVFQANIARFWSRPFAAGDLPVLHARLRQLNPAPFSAWAAIGDGEDVLTLVSASPERLFRLDGAGGVETRPIAGTRRRGEGEDDRALSRELLLSEKERAEHVMLVDLERNDLGRVCAPGSVRVDERMVIERYATVQHIVSNVRGRLRGDADLVDVLGAMFPGGTITGCPKVRCMEIIHALEPRARGPYTGGLGWQAWSGEADMNILIRTFWHWRGRLHWAAGAGIVADSDPRAERLETEHKAAGLLRALGDAA